MTAHAIVYAPIGQGTRSEQVVERLSNAIVAGLLHADIMTVSDQKGLQQYCYEPRLTEERTGQQELEWVESPSHSLDTSVLTSMDKPFDSSGGLQLLAGNLGRGIIKISAVKPEHRKVTAPAVVFDDQDQLIDAFRAGDLNRDFVAVLRYQGPRANGMPELHKLTPSLSVLQDRGYKVALVTDGRMSGASGKVPMAIHMTPECAMGGPLALVQSGDMVSLDADAGTLELLLSTEALQNRIPLTPRMANHQQGCGRELFATFRHVVGTAENGASSLLETAV